MSYLVLARKWRPQVFSDLIGQEHVSRTLVNAICSGRVHHAFLFTGARGVGKTSAARILAKALNCEQGPSAEPCNQCSSCLEISAGTSVDVFEIDGASNTGVDDVRELRDTLRYMPSRSRYKIYIIDEVHMLSINAFNALLKTLEEPPEHVKFIFATTEPHKIPVTILSRCQRFDFRKIPQIRVTEQLRRIVDAEGIGISDRALALVAQRGGGSMRDSLSTLDQVVAFCSERVDDDDVLALLGMVDRRLLVDALEGCMQQQPALVFETVRRVDDLGFSFRQFCQELVELTRQVLLCNLVADPADVFALADDEVRELKMLAGLAGDEDWHRLLSMLLKTEAELASSSYPRLLVEMTLVRAASLPPSRDIQTLIRKLENLQGQVVGETMLCSPVVAPSPVSAEKDGSVKRQERPVREAESASPVLATAPGTETTDSSPDLVADWPGFVAMARKKRPRIGAILADVSLLEWAPPSLRLGAGAGSFLCQQLQDRDVQQSISSLAEDFFGQPVTLKVEGVSGQEAPLSLSETRRKEESDRERRLRDDALGHPMVKKAVEVFSGEVLSVKATDKGFV